MTKLYSGETADDVWLLAAQQFKQNVEIDEHLSQKGPVKEVLQAIFTINDPLQRWVGSRFPAINPAFALAEVVWIMNGMNESGFINHWNPKLPLYCGESEYYHGAYGYRLRKHFGIDQLQRAYETLKGSPASRHAVMNIWDVNSDLPECYGEPRSPDIPCNISCMLKIRNGHLDWTQINRSNDLFLGVPHNFVQFTYLQEIMAGWLNVKVGKYTHFSDSLHVYSEYYNSVCESQRISLPKSNDSIKLGKIESERSFFDLRESAIGLISSSSEKEFMNILSCYEGDQSLRNILLILAADCALRKNQLVLSNRVLELCTNEVFCELWCRWLDRKSRNNI